MNVIAAPTAPTNLAAQAGDRQVSLSWTAPTGGSTVGGYYIYRYGQRFAKTTATRYTNTGLTDGTTYTYYVVAYGTNGRLSPSSPTVSATPAPTPYPPVNESLPTISGSALVGHVLTSSTGSWHNAPTSYAYAWDRCSSAGANCSAISGATASTYVLTSTDVGSTIEAAVTARNAGGSASASSTPSAVVQSQSQTQTTPTTTTTTPTTTTPTTTTPTTTTPGGTPPPSGSLYVATTGSDSNPCTQAQPCLSFDRAYHAASAGQTVAVESGTYNSPWTDAGGQVWNGEEITWDPSKASASSNVVFQPDAGATVYVAGNLRVMSSHVEFHNMALEDPNNPMSKGTIEAFNYDPVGNNPGNDVGNIVFANLVARDFSIMSVHDMTMSGTSIGPESLCGSSQPSLPQYGGGENKIFQEAGAPDPNNLTFSNDTIHNAMSYNLVSCHIAGIVFFAGTNVTITGSKFYGNDVLDIEIQNSIGAINHVTLTNNWFGQATNQAGTGVGSANVSFENNDGSPGTYADSLVEGNSSNGVMQFDSTEAGINPTNFRIIGNVGQMAYSGYCPTGFAADFHYNVWQNSACGSTDANLNGAPFPFVNPTNDAAMNYQLASGSVAQDFVPTSVNTLTTDLSGNARADGGESFVDAGASELP